MKYDLGHNSTFNYNPGQFLTGLQLNVDSWTGSFFNVETWSGVTVQRGILSRGNNSTCNCDRVLFNVEFWPGSEFVVEPLVTILRGIMSEVKSRHEIMTRVKIQHGIFIRLAFRVVDTPISKTAKICKQEGLSEWIVKAKIPALKLCCGYKYTRPCMINRSWALKQLWLQVNGHVDFIFMGSAELFGTGRCLQRDSNPRLATPRHVN